MPARFPHLKNNESNFPELQNVNVYKYDNDFDYSRYDHTQMRLTLCTVPWDVGEAHIGARTISGIGNVVYFGSKEERDAWFDAIPDTECYRFDTKYKELYRDMYVDVPVPFDMCSRHNYLVSEYEVFAHDGSLVEYEDYNGHRKWFWFVREVEFIAPNTTRLHLLDDAFQTWIYDVNVSGMILERGHAPAFAMKADAYLSNPIDNNRYLLTEDVNFGDATQVQHIDAIALNAGDMYACVATSANPAGVWGTKAADTWKVPASSYYLNTGVPSVYVFAVAVSDLNTLLANIDTYVPQFKQTVQGVFFASADLVTLGSSFTFASVTCYGVSSTRKTIDLCTLNKSMFGYDSKYANLAKLYTSPYAHIEITDENGNPDIIKIEDTTGNIDASVALSLAYPFITIEAHLSGVGGKATKSVTFRNVNSHTFPVSGQWYDTLRSWDVPTFAVVQEASNVYDYSTHFDRAQRIVDYETAYSNAMELATAAKADRDASADMNKTNTDAIADTAKANADASADTITDNALLQTTTNTALTSISNGSADNSLDNTRTYNFDSMDADNAYTNATATSQIQAAEEQAAISSAAGAAQGAASGFASGGIMGAIGGLIEGAIGAAATMASTNVSTHLTSTEASLANGHNQDKSEAATQKTQDDVSNQKSAANSTNTAVNALTSGTAANNAATEKANATREQTTVKANATLTQTTEKANALRDYDAASANATRDRAQAQSAIQNDIKQAALEAPSLFGDFRAGDSATTKPMALFAHVVTQSKSAIESAGDEFLRYGYMFDKQWAFDGNWNVGKYFTYWKLRDFWVTNLNVPDLYMDKIRFFLFGGVTIWRKPEYIGKHSIYENFNG